MIDDVVIVPVVMKGADYIVIYQIAQSRRRTVSEFVMEALIDYVQKLQEEWRKSQTPKQEVKEGR